MNGQSEQIMVSVTQAKAGGTAQFIPPRCVLVLSSMRRSIMVSVDTCFGTTNVLWHFHASPDPKACIRLFRFTCKFQLGYVGLWVVTTPYWMFAVLGVHACRKPFSCVSTPSLFHWKMTSNVEMNSVSGMVFGKAIHTLTWPWLAAAAFPILCLLPIQRIYCDNSCRKCSLSYQSFFLIGLKRHTSRFFKYWCIKLYARPAPSMPLTVSELFSTVLFPSLVSCRVLTLRSQTNQSFKCLDSAVVASIMFHLFRHAVFGSIY